MKYLVKQIIQKLSLTQWFRVFLENVYMYSHVKEQGNHLIPYSNFHPLDNTHMKLMNDPQSLLVVTFEKSGSHWFRSLLGNYIHKLINPSLNTPLSNQDILKLYFPIWRSCYEAPKKHCGTPLNQYFNFNNILFQHILTYDCDIHHFLGKKLFLARNPLDSLISNYFFWDIKNSIQNFLPFYITKFAKSYSYLQKISQQDSLNSCWVFYEDLKTNTSATLQSVLTFFDIPINQTAITFALNSSSVKTLKKFEENGNSISKHKSHVRSGQIGEWKQYLNDKHVSIIESILKRYKISLSDFTLD